MESIEFNDHWSAISIAANRTETKKSHILVSLLRWTLNALIGVMVGSMGVLIIYSSRYLSSWKFSIVGQFISTPTTNDDNNTVTANDSISIASSFFIFSGISLFFALGATLTVLYGEPLATSSGIPEIKAYLNGIYLPRLLHIRTIVCKIIGVIFSVSSGLAVGYEGPMVHIGSGISSMVSDNYSPFSWGCLSSSGKKSVTRTCCASSSSSSPSIWSLSYTHLQNNRERRDFAVGGAASGIASAFNSPIGGVLFTMEEAATWWPKMLTWRVYFTAMIAAYTLAFILSGVSSGNWGEINQGGMFSFGDFTSTGQITNSRWHIYELPIFICIGILTGIIGAIFNYSHGKLTKFRLNYIVPYRERRLGEVLGITLLVCFVSFFVPLYFGTCLPRPTMVLPPPSTTDPLLSSSRSSSFTPSVALLLNLRPFTGSNDDTNNNNNNYAVSLVSMYCPSSEYNDLASLWFAPAEDAIRQLFHLPNVDAFSVTHLLSFFLAYTFLMGLCSGLALPAGLFIPSLLAGSSFGRLVGVGINLYTPFTVDPGTYALVGAGAMLGGLTRMTISLSVILLECTGNYQFALPLMLTLISARFVGNYFTEGIYDTHIQLRRLPVLEDHPKKTVAQELRVSDIMTREPLVFREIEQVGRVLDVLQSFQHNGFPVVYSEQMMKQHPRLGTLAGYIQRKHLAVLLERKAFHKDLPSQPWDCTHAPSKLPNDTEYGKGKDTFMSSSSSYLYHPPSVFTHSVTVDDKYASGSYLPPQQSPLFLHRLSENPPLVQASPPVTDPHGIHTSETEKHDSTSEGDNVWNIPPAPSSRHGSFLPPSASCDSFSKLITIDDNDDERDTLLAKNTKGTVAHREEGTYTPPSFLLDPTHDHYSRSLSFVSNASQEARTRRSSSTTFGNTKQASSSAASSSSSSAYRNPKSGTTMNSSPLAPHSPSISSSSVHGYRKRGSTMTRISSEIRLSLPATTESHRLASEEVKVNSSSSNGKSNKSISNSSNNGIQPSGNSPILGALPYCSSFSSSSARLSVPHITTEVPRSSVHSHNDVKLLSTATSVSRSPIPSLYNSGSLSYQPNILLPSEDSVGNGVWSAVTGRAHGTFRPLRMPSGEMYSPNSRSVPDEVSSTLVGIEYASTGYDPYGKETFSPRLFPIPSFADSSSRVSSAEYGNGIRPHNGSTNNSNNGNLPLLLPLLPTHGNSTLSVPSRLPHGTVHPASTMMEQSIGHVAMLALVANRQEYAYDSEPLLTLQELEAHYPRYPDISTITLTSEERDMYIDLRPYMDPSPVTVHVHAPVVRAFKIHRTLGLRHLIVTNDCYDVVGIITRHELVDSALYEKLERIQRQDAEEREVEGERS